MMTDEELLRYSRQILLPELDVEGPEKLRASTALIVGLGGLGSPVALYLAAAGVGRLILVDHDNVDLSNLQRQVAHQTDSIGLPKVESAAASARRLNPHCDIVTVAEKLDDKYLIREDGLSAKDLDTAVVCIDPSSLAQPEPQGSGQVNGVA